MTAYAWLRQMRESTDTDLEARLRRIDQALASLAARQATFEDEAGLIQMELAKRAGRHGRCA
jgi:hypothetical protein